MKSHLIPTAVAAVLLSASIALAADEAKPKKGKAAPFAAADTNQDGKLDLAEFAAMNKKNPDPVQAKKRFARIDTDKDGFLSPVEMQAARKKAEDGGGKKPQPNPEN